MSHRILLVTDWYPAFDASSKRTRAIANIVRAMRSSGVETVVVAPNKDVWGIRVGRVYGQPVLSVPWQYPEVSSSSPVFQGARFGPLPRMLLKLLRPWFLRKRLLRSLRGFRLDRMLRSQGPFEAVVIHGRLETSYDLVRKVWKGPVSICFHTTDTLIETTGQFLAANKSLIKNIAFRSDSLRKAFIRRGWVSEGPYHLVHSGVEASTILPRQQYRTRNPGDRLRLLVVGALSRRKNIDFVLRTLGLWKNRAWDLQIYGKGPEEANLKALADELGISQQVNFGGYVESQILMKEYAKHDVFVLLSRPETFGMVYTEALSQGLFAIGSRGEGIDGVIRDGVNGFLVEPGDAPGLLAALDRITMMSPSEESAFKDRIYQTMEGLTNEKIAKDYRRFFVGLP